MNSELNWYPHYVHNNDNIYDAMPQTVNDDNDDDDDDDVAINANNDDDDDDDDDDASNCR